MITFISHQNHMLNRLKETVQMRDYNRGFYAELTKVIPNTCIAKYSLLSRALPMPSKSLKKQNLNLSPASHQCNKTSHLLEFW